MRSAPETRSFPLLVVRPKTMLARIKRKFLSRFSKPDSIRRHVILTTFAFFGLTAALAIAVGGFGLAGGNEPPSFSSLGGSGITEWRFLNDEVRGGRFSLDVHHVIASHEGIFAVYSVNAVADGATLSSDIQVRRVTDGVVNSKLSADLLVSTGDTAAVRIASLGAPTVGAKTYGMSLSGLGATDNQTPLSIGVVEDTTPDEVEGGVSIMTNPDPDVLDLLHGGYWVIGPQGTAFGILPGVAGGEETPSYFKISPGGIVQQITFEELVDFNGQHRR